MLIERRLAAIAVVLALSSLLSAQVTVELAANTPTTQPQARSEARVAAPANDYVIGVDDVIAISVWKEPELSRVLPVRPDGKITLPLVGDVQAAGRTPQQLQQELHESLAAYVAVPEVAVIVQEVRSQKFNIVGQVARPGSYSLTESTTVLDAIAEAGGVGIYAKSNSIYVLRVQADGSSVQLPFRYKQVLKGTNLSQNVKLQPRDTVVVP
ncbi:MAG TPA: polysaccharide biosynthesis/export family protein [Candidatus Angelobacter sp.]|jgi:polysaccharide export outer membrane protein|nr:polysaccharide biosynthesis/export family protein [Candidatus Angelobacter sp.]